MKAFLGSFLSTTLIASLFCVALLFAQVAVADEDPSGPVCHIVTLDEGGYSECKAKLFRWCTAPKECDFYFIGFTYVCGCV